MVVTNKITINKVGGYVVNLNILVKFNMEEIFIK